MSKTPPNLASLFAGAKDDGLLSPASSRALAIPDLGAAIQAGLGVSVDDVPASEVVLVTMLIDDSGSIRFASNSEAVRDGHNAVLEALTGSKQGHSVIVHTRYLNGQVLYPYTPIDAAVRMTAANYNPNGGTPLYDQSVVLLGTVIAKTREFEANGVPVRTVTCLVTDGNDEHSVRATAATVRTLVGDMLKSERHIIAGMGVEDGHTDFRAVFREMGLEDSWIMTPGNSPSEIRRAFAVFSQSAVRASQNATAFSKTAAGGFAAP